MSSNFDQKRIKAVVEETTLTDDHVIPVDAPSYGVNPAKKTKLSTLRTFLRAVSSFIGLSDVPSSYTNKAFHKLYVKEDETGLEFKGNAEDYAPLAVNELDGLTVEVTKSVDGVIVANAMTSVSGLTANTIRNTDIGIPNRNAKVVYYDVDTETLATILLSDLGGGSNIATNDLVFTGNSTTDFAGYKATFDNAEVKIVSDANTSGDVLFEATQSDGITSIFKITGNSRVAINADTNSSSRLYINENNTVGLNEVVLVSIDAGAANGVNVVNAGTGNGVNVENSSSGYAAYITSSSSGHGIYSNTSGTGHAAWLVGNSSQFALRIQGARAYLHTLNGDSGGSGLYIDDGVGVQVLTVRGDGYLISEKLKNSSSYIDDAEAAAGGVPVAALYRNGSVVQIRLS